MGGAEESHQDHGNLWSRGTPRHRAQHGGAEREKKHMTAGGSGWSLTPTWLLWALRLTTQCSCNSFPIQYIYSLAKAEHVHFISS